MKLLSDLEIEGGRDIVASLSSHATHSEIFDALILGYLQWCSAKPSLFSQFHVFIEVESKNPAHEELLHYIVDRWNATEKPWCPGRVEIFFDEDGDEESHYGITNGPYPDDPSTRTQTVRYVTGEEIDAELIAATREMEERERVRRRSNPVLDPVELPKSIASEMARYLKLEFPQFEEDRLTARKLKFVGELRVNGVPTQFWSIAAETMRPMWGVVERFDDFYILSSTDDLPIELCSDES